MIRYIHYSWALPKQLVAMRQAGKKSELAAGKCETILHEISQNGIKCETVLSHRTRNGEARIKNCVKYDLGGGYRLVTIRADCHLFIAFTGSHDDTDQWIEHHRYDTFAPSKALYRCEEQTATPDVAEDSNGESADAGNLGDEYEDRLTARLDESQLRAVFQGLFMTPSRPIERSGSEKPIHLTRCVKGSG